MKRKLYLHIGVHRTGTTSIQNFLRQNFHVLQRHGFLNPGGKGRNIGLVNTYFAGSQTPRGLADDLNARAGSKDAKIDSFIISDEDICFRRELSPLSNLTEYFDVCVLVSLRRQDLWLESWYLQNIKWQWDPELSHRTLKEFLERREDFHWIHYDALLDQLASLFGKDKLTVSVFERDQMPGGPVKKFAEDIGLRIDNDFRLPEAANSSVSAEMSEFLRLLPLEKLPDRIRSIVERAAIETDVMRRGASAQTPLLLTEEWRRQILSVYEEGNKRIARDYFGRERLFLDPLPGPEEPISRLALPESSEAAVKNIVAPFLLKLMEKFPETSPKRQ